MVHEWLVCVIPALKDLLTAYAEYSIKYMKNKYREQNYVLYHE